MSDRASVQDASAPRLLSLGQCHVSLPSGISTHHLRNLIVSTASSAFFALSPPSAFPLLSTLIHFADSTHRHSHPSSNSHHPHLLVSSIPTPIASRWPNHHSRTELRWAASRRGEWVKRCRPMIEPEDVPGFAGVSGSEVGDCGPCGGDICHGEKDDEASC